MLILKQTAPGTPSELDKMCKYEMDPTSIGEDTERTPLLPQTDGQTDRRTDKVKPVYPLSTSLKRGLWLDIYVISITNLLRLIMRWIIFGTSERNTGTYT